jgi:hypothetical protein
MLSSKTPFYSINYDVFYNFDFQFNLNLEILMQTCLLMHLIYLPRNTHTIYTYDIKYTPSIQKYKQKFVNKSECIWSKIWIKISLNYFCWYFRTEGVHMIYYYILFIFLTFTTNLIWFESQFWHQVVPAFCRSQLPGIKLWSSLLSSTSITTEPTNYWYYYILFT